MKRAQKVNLLTQLIQGQLSRQALQQLKAQQLDSISIVVCGFEEIQPADLVYVYPGGQQSSQPITYTEFKQNPQRYGNLCIVAN